MSNGNRKSPAPEEADHNHEGGEVTPPYRHTPPPEPHKEKTGPSAAERAQWHGYLLADSTLPVPQTAVDSKDLARPAYTRITSAEYLDPPEALDAKADLLIQMFQSAKQRMIYAGAGLSTSSGIWDYASNAAGSLVQPKKRALTRSLIDGLRPTPGHRVLVAMERAGMIEHWLQQNHDGLAQRAGFPWQKLNELHGSWHDPTNPVIKMSGNLRSDLCEWMYEWEKKADLVLAVGTSFSGLNADRCADACAHRHMDKGQGQGLIIISIQKTPMDPKAALRVFAKIDDFMMIVAKKLKLELDTKIYPYRASITGGPSKSAVANTGDPGTARANSPLRTASKSPAVPKRTPSRSPPGKK